MAVRPSGEKRKRRCLMATDAEWAHIRREADEAGLTIADYVMRSLEALPVSAISEESVLPPSVLRRAVRAALVLEELERRRLANQGAEKLWHARAAEADTWIDAECGLN